MNYFEVKVRYTRPNVNGKLFDTVSELYLVNAFTFGMAEQRVLDHVKGYAFPDSAIEVIAMKIVSYDTVKTSPYDQVNGTTFFRAKVILTIIDDQGKEKKQPLYMLVYESNIENATGAVRSEMSEGYGYCEWNIDTIQETKVLEVLDTVTVTFHTSNETEE